MRCGLGIGNSTKDFMAGFFKLIARQSFCVLVLTGSAWSQTAGPPRPGSINYLEGQASIGTTAGTMALTPGAVGSVVLQKDHG
jgi:hypothetical protein